MNDLSLEDRKLIYQARRGLKELDFFIDPYVKKYLIHADSQEKKIFARLLAYEDPDLLNWFMDVEKPNDKDVEKLIVKIRNLKDN